MTVTAAPAPGAITQPAGSASWPPYQVIPVTRRLLADDGPIGVYRKLAGDRPGTFLFESAENGRS
jgi:anthranilate synthase component 1